MMYYSKLKKGFYLGQLCAMCSRVLLITKKCCYLLNDCVMSIFVVSLQSSAQAVERRMRGLFDGWTSSRITVIDP